MLELDRSFGAIDVALKKAVVLCFTKGLSNCFVVKHREIVGDNEVKLLIGPIASFDLLFRHRHQDKLPCQFEQSSAGYLPFDTPNTSLAARSPESLAPCAVEKKFGEVASPAKNSFPSTGAASTARLPAWPGRACE